MTCRGTEARVSVGSKGRGREGDEGEGAHLFLLAEGHVLADAGRAALGVAGFTLGALGPDAECACAIDVCDARVVGRGRREVDRVGSEAGRQEVGRLGGVVDLGRGGREVGRRRAGCGRGRVVGARGRRRAGVVCGGARRRGGARVGRGSRARAGRPAAVGVGGTAARGVVVVGRGLLIQQRGRLVVVVVGGCGGGS